MRLQVMILPAPGEATPWVLILDNVGPLSPDHMDRLSKRLNASAKALGGKGGLVFSEKVEVA